MSNFSYLFFFIYHFVPLFFDTLKLSVNIWMESNERGKGERLSKIRRQECKIYNIMMQLTTIVQYWGGKYIDNPNLNIKNKFLVNRQNIMISGRSIGHF